MAKEVRMSDNEFRCAVTPYAAVCLLTHTMVLLLLLLLRYLWSPLCVHCRLSLGALLQSPNTRTAPPLLRVASIVCMSPPLSACCLQHRLPSRQANGFKNHGQEHHVLETLLPMCLLLSLVGTYIVVLPFPRALHLVPPTGDVGLAIACLILVCTWVGTEVQVS